MTRTRPRISAPPTRNRASQTLIGCGCNRAGRNRGALDSRWRRLGSEFRRSGGKGERPAAPTAPPPPLMSRDSMSTGTSLGFIPTAKRREGCYGLTLALPASTFLRRCSCSSSISIWAPRESLGGGRRPRNRFRSIYTPSLHPLASPPPYTQLSAPPRQSGAQGGLAHARSSDAPRAESHRPCPQLVR